MLDGNDVSIKKTGTYDQLVMVPQGTLICTQIPKDEIICPATGTVGCHYIDKHYTSSRHILCGMRGAEIMGDSKEHGNFYTCFVGERYREEINFKQFADLSGSRLIDEIKGFKYLGVIKNGARWEDAMIESYKRADSTPHDSADYVEIMKQYSVSREPKQNVISKFLGNFVKGK